MTTKEKIIHTAVLLAIFGTMIFGVYKMFRAMIRGNVRYQEQQLNLYQECKTKTSDIEWCVKTIKPVF